MPDDQPADQPFDDEHVDGSSRNRTAGEDPGAYIGHEPERATETIPGGLGPADERVAAVASQPGAETGGASGEMPASAAGLYSPLQRYSIRDSTVKKLPCAKPLGTQIHSAYGSSVDAGMSYIAAWPNRGEPCRMSMKMSTILPASVRSNLP